MSGFEGLLAGIIIIQAAILLVFLYFLYRVVAKLAERTDKLLTRIEPEMDDLAAGIRAIRQAAEFSTTEIRATMAAVRTTTEELDRFTRTEAVEIARIVGRATAMAERQLDQLDLTLDAGLGRVREIGEGLDRSLLDPARNIFAVVTGIKRAIGALAAARGSSNGHKAGSVQPPDPWSDPVDVGAL